MTFGRRQLSRRGLVIATGAAIAAPAQALQASERELISLVERALSLNAAMEMAKASPSPYRGLRFDDPRVLAEEARINGIVTEFWDAVLDVSFITPMTLGGLHRKALLCEAAARHGFFPRINEAPEDYGEPHQLLAWQLTKDVRQFLTPT